MGERCAWLLDLVEDEPDLCARPYANSSTWDADHGCLEQSGRHFDCLPSSARHVASSYRGKTRESKTTFDHAQAMATA